jgi:LPS-assembly lipoprotein
VTGRATNGASYDTAGQQRFARISGMQDAAHRAAKAIADNITARLASYFVNGS